MIYFTSLEAFSQTSFCDTETGPSFNEQIEQLLFENRNARKLSLNEQIDVPITFHIEKAGGNPVISESKISSALATVNSWYTNGNISFSRCGETRFYNDGDERDINDRAINVIVYKGNAGCGATAKHIYINVNCSRTFQLILAHELGHVLGLPHTHGLGNTGVTAELVDGSNCDVAGDRFCDTPADPNLLNKVNANTCIYTGTAKDPNGQTYKPDVSNIMSYSMDACMNSFSNLQFEKARQVAQARGYVCCLTPEPTVAGKSICGGESTTLSASAPQGTIKWYNTAEGGTLLGTGASYTTNPLSTTSAFYVEAIDGCASARVEALVTVNPPSGVITAIAENFKEIDPDPTKGSWPRNLLVKNDLLYLIAKEKLYVTDGNPDNFTQLYDGDIARLFDYKDGVVAASNHDSKGPVLVFTKGTVSSTKEVKAFGNSYEYSNFESVVVGDLFYFIVNAPGEKAELWRWNGGNETTKLANLNNSPWGLFYLTAAGNNAFFIDKDGNGDEELYKVNGNGIARVKNINPTASSQPSYLVNSNGSLYFLADDGTNGRELWTSDGTEKGTFMLVDVNPGGDAKADLLASVGGSLYFGAFSPSVGFEPFVTDGTTEGTRPVGDLNPGGDSKVYNFYELNGEVYFVADNEIVGSELWKVDPMAPRGARLVKDINPSGGSGVSYAAVIDGLLYFSANDGNFNNELWRSDGTESGTFQVAEINKGAGSSFPQEFISYKNTLFFSATPTTNNRELWYLNEQNLQVCSGNAVTIKTGNPAGSIAWYDKPTGGTKLSSAINYTTSRLQRNTNFFVTLTAGGCSTARKLVQVTVTAPLPEIENDTIFENETATLSAKVTSGNVQWFKNKSDANPFHTGDSYTTSQLQSTATYFVRTVENECTSAWQEVKAVVVPSFNLTVENGSGAGRYAENDKIIINAHDPPAGHVFNQWQGDVQYLDDKSMPATKITMQARDMAVNATYKATSKPTYRLTINKGQGSGIYEEGTSIKIYAEKPEEEILVFKEWTGDITNLNDASKTEALLTMPGSTAEITAEFSFDIDVTSVKEHEIAKIKIYPNPVKGEEVNINIDQSDGNYQLFDPAGNLVKEGQLYYGDNNLDVYSLTSGMYFVKIKLKNAAFNDKIIID